jgi:hypothetical protein
MLSKNEQDTEEIIPIGRNFLRPKTTSHRLTEQIAPQADDPQNAAGFNWRGKVCARIKKACEERPEKTSHLKPWFPNFTPIKKLSYWLGQTFQISLLDGLLPFTGHLFRYLHLRMATMLGDDYIFSTARKLTRNEWLDFLTQHRTFCSKIDNPPICDP